MAELKQTNNFHVEGKKIFHFPKLSSNTDYFFIIQKKLFNPVTD